MSKRISLNDREIEGKGIKKAISAFVSNVSEKSDLNNDTKNESNNDTNNESNIDTKLKNKRIKENVVVSKKVSIGGVKLQIDYEKNEMKRIPYQLQTSTIEKIKLVSQITNLKKYELVDLILSSVCDEILKKTNTD